MQISSAIFKAYDIRGIVGSTLTLSAVEAIGRALGVELLARGGVSVAIGRDGRLSGTDFAKALSRGLQRAGANVIDVGMVATPMAYFASYQLQTGSAVMITGSHNPPDYNGLKMVLAGETIWGEAIQTLRKNIEQDNLPDAAVSGSYSTASIREDYLSRIISDVKLARPMKIIVDAGNGIAGATAPELYRRMGCDVTELFCEVDGNFPNHHPDPSQPKNLQDLMQALGNSDAELGLAFDGDGDRLGVVTKDGEIIYPDRQLLLLAQDVLSRNPGAEIIYDVKCTRNLAPWIRKHGGAPVIWKTGHSLIKAKMRETGAPLAGEMSGHTFFKERWYGFDDGLYAGARLLEILSRTSDASAALKALPNSINTPELNLALAEGEPPVFIEKLCKSARFDAAVNIIDIDGLRVEYTDGFGLARASNTTPVIVLRFEADSEAALKRIQEDFRKNLLVVKPEAKLPF